MNKKRYSQQKLAKLYSKKCYFCDESQYELLDAHRIIPGEKGGKYTDNNILVVCATHHRMIHADIIKVDRKYPTMTGNWTLHYWINGEEKWK